MDRIKIKLIIFSAVCAGCVCFAGAQRQRPVIGLSDIYKNGGSSVPRSYVEAVLSVDGIPVVIPLMYEDDKIIELLKSLDGIIFTGGEDFDPSYYNEKAIPNMNRINAPRDVFDIKLLRLAVEQGIPVLGICRGVQLINIAYGGSLYQDLAAQYPDKSIRHRQTQSKEEASHAVIVEDGTVFADIVGERMLMVNSSHHQAIKKLASGFRVAGVSPDKIVEVIEKVDSAHWIVGVQFHPEVMVDNDPPMHRIFKGFIDEASRMKSKKQQLAHANIPAIPVSVPESGVISRKEDVHAPLSSGADAANVKVSDENVSTSSDRDISVSDNENREKTVPYSSKERRRVEIKRIREKEKQHDENLKEREKREKKELKEKEKQEKEDFNKWVQQRKWEEKVQKEKEKAAGKEAEEKEKSAKREAAEKEKQRQKEREEKAAKDKKDLKEQARQKKIAEKEAEEKEKSAKREAAEKEKQRQKELEEKAAEMEEQARQKKIAEKEAEEKEKAAKQEAVEKEKQRQKELEEKEAKDKAEKEQKEKEELAKKEAEEKSAKQEAVQESVEKEKQEAVEKNQKEPEEKTAKDKKELKEQERQKKIAEKERKKKEKAAGKEAKEKEKQYQREQKERAKTDKKELKKMEKQKKAEEKKQKKEAASSPS